MGEPSHAGRDFRPDLVTTISAMPCTSTSIPFGTAYLPSLEVGVDLAAFGYQEEEFWVTGIARQWGYGPAFSPQPVRKAPYATRVLLRRPADPGRFSGAVHLEPLHPDLDRAPSWALAHDWIMRGGHAWVGVTQSPTVASDLASRLPDRYSGFSIEPGLGYDMLGGVAKALKDGRMPIAGVRHITMSGWSITGSFCRVYLQEGFGQRHLDLDGAPAVDAILIGKSSGGLAGPGYPPLSPTSAPLPEDHPRRVVRGAVPTFEVLSESEGETHGLVLRPDSDAPGDRYRLIEIAGTTHRELRTGVDSPNAVQYASLGGESSDARINELPSDADFGIFAGAIFEQLHRWVVDGVAPPNAPRFEHEGPGARIGGRLRRDENGTVVGGIRPPWLVVPTSWYHPTSTPAPGAFQPLARFPGAGSPEHAASLIGHRVPFTPDELAVRYQGAAHVLALIEAHCRELVAARYLLHDDATRYVNSLRHEAVSG